MGTNWTVTLLALAMFGQPGAPAKSADDLMAASLLHQAQAGDCHPVILPAECQAHLAALAGLPEGSAERVRLIAEHAALIREREAACSCAQQISTVVSRQPRHTARQF